MSAEGKGIVFAAIVALLAGCAAPTGEEGVEVGTLVAPLGTTAAGSGVRFQLRDAVFRIYGVTDPLFELSLNSEDFDPDAEVASVDLVRGEYRVVLQPGWRLERQVEPGVFAEVTAELTSPANVPVNISPFEVSAAGFAFLSEGDIISMDPGQLDIDIEVQALEEIINSVPVRYYNSVRPAEDGCGTRFVVTGPDAIDVNAISSLNDLDADGRLRYVIFDELGEALWLSPPKAFADDGMSWKRSDLMSFSLQPGAIYDVLALADVPALYGFDTLVESAGGIETMVRNPNARGFDAPVRRGNAGADCGIRLFTLP